MRIRLGELRRIVREECNRTPRHSRIVSMHEEVDRRKAAQRLRQAWDEVGSAQQGDEPQEATIAAELAADLGIPAETATTIIADFSRVWPTLAPGDVDGEQNAGEEEATKEAVNGALALIGAPAKPAKSLKQKVTPRHVAAARKVAAALRAELGEPDPGSNRPTWNVPLYGAADELRDALTAAGLKVYPGVGPIIVELPGLEVTVKPSGSGGLGQIRVFNV